MRDPSSILVDLRKTNWICYYFINSWYIHCIDSTVIKGYNIIWIFALVFVLNSKIASNFSYAQEVTGASIEFNIGALDMLRNIFTA